MTDPVVIALIAAGPGMVGAIASLVLPGRRQAERLVRVETKLDDAIGRLGRVEAKIDR
jgi:hypothetical protein